MKNPGMPDTAFLHESGFLQDLQAFLAGAERIFILGIGMDWKSDDRLGPTLARAIARNLPAAPDIRIVDGGEAPENFTGTARAFAPTHVILIDAIDRGMAAGTACLVEEKDLSMGDMTSHHLPLKLLMRFLRESIPCRVILVGVQPQTLLPGNKLSPPIKRTLPLLAQFLAKTLQERIEK